MEIRRTWHGWTTQENAEAYEEVLRDHVLPSIEAKRIPGYIGIEVLRRDRPQRLAPGVKEAGT